MKCSELMIGDWVQGFSENTFAKILEISHCGRVLIVTKDGQTIGLNSEDIQPIPLTEGIMKMNNIHYEYLEHHDMECMIKYVHELQHLLRLDGNVEQADNFKIKEE